MAFVAIGGIAQLGERLLCKQEVVGSIPSASTSFRKGVLVSMARGEPPKLDENRRKEPQHGNVNSNERSALVAVSRKGRDHGQVKKKCK